MTGRVGAHHALRGLLPALAAAGLAIATYLTWTKLAGVVPACGPLRGCETVNTSPYSEIAGIPVAAIGMGYSGVLLVASLAWASTSDRRALLAAYAHGLAGSMFLAYLTYLELFVIRAVCVWCVAYGLTVVGGMLLAALALRRAGWNPAGRDVTSGPSPRRVTSSGDPRRRLGRARGQRGRRR